MELQTPKNGVIGTDMPVRDAALKVTGQFKYVGDMTLPHMLHAKVLFSPVAQNQIHRHQPGGAVRRGPGGCVLEECAGCPVQQLRRGD